MLEGYGGHVAGLPQTGALFGVLERGAEERT